MVTILLKKSISPVNQLEKSFDGSGTSFSCALKDPVNIESPTFILQSDVNIWEYNYIDASDFSGRQYFITDRRSIGNGRYEVDARTDVLSTWSDDIKECFAVIDKQEGRDLTNKYLNDGSFISQVDEFNTSYNFPGCFNDSPVFILICAGG